MRKEIAHEHEEAERTQTRAAKRVGDVKGEREKLLQAYYAGAVPQDLLKQEMDRLTRDITHAENELAAASRSIVELDATLEQALTIAGACHRHYATATPRIRRQINQGLFDGLFIGRDGEVERHELTEPFAKLLDAQMGNELARRAAGLKDEVPSPRTAEALDGRWRPSGVFAAVSGGNTNTAQDDLLDGGLHMSSLVQQVQKSFHQIRDEIARWRNILAVPYQVSLASKRHLGVTLL